MIARGIPVPLDVAYARLDRQLRALRQRGIADSDAVSRRYAETV
jgi:hypothetical protein